MLLLVSRYEAVNKSWLDQGQRNYRQVMQSLQLTLVMVHTREVERPLFVPRTYVLRLKIHWSEVQSCCVGAR